MISNSRSSSGSNVSDKEWLWCFLPRQLTTHFLLCSLVPSRSLTGTKGWESLQQKPTVSFSSSFVLYLHLLSNRTTNTNTAELSPALQEQCQFIPSFPSLFLSLDLSRQESKTRIQSTEPECLCTYSFVTVLPSQSMAPNLCHLPALSRLGNLLLPWPACMVRLTPVFQSTLCLGLSQSLPCCNFCFIYLSL